MSAVSTYRFKAVQALDLPSGNERVHVPQGAEFTIEMDAQQFTSFIAGLVIKHIDILTVDGKPPEAASRPPVVRPVGFGAW